MKFEYSWYLSWVWGSLIRGYVCILNRNGNIDWMRHSIVSPAFYFLFIFFKGGKSPKKVPLSRTALVYLSKYSSFFLWARHMNIITNKGWSLRNKIVAPPSASNGDFSFLSRTNMVLRNSLETQQRVGIQKVITCRVTRPLIWYWLHRFCLGCIKLLPLHINHRL